MWNSLWKEHEDGDINRYCLSITISNVIVFYSEKDISWAK